MESVAPQQSPPLLHYRARWDRWTAGPDGVEMTTKRREVGEVATSCPAGGVNDWSHLAGTGWCGFTVVRVSFFTFLTYICVQKEEKDLEREPYFWTVVGSRGTCREPRQTRGERKLHTERSQAGNETHNLFTALTTASPRRL